MILKRFAARSFPTLSRFYSTQPSHPRVVLGIETSCDDTGVALVSTDRRILAERVFSQWSEHKRLGRATQRHSQLTAFAGGVVPNLARQLHYDILPRAVSECLEEAFGEADWSRVDALAVTVKPGLEPCLWEGINFSKLLLKKHTHLLFVPVHHMQAHALTCRLVDANIRFPFLTLLISGGHCLLALVRDHQTFEILGQSVDISPGNCVDKIARQLGLFELGPPSGQVGNACQSGGALVEAYALNGDPNEFISTLHMIKNYCYKNKDCQFSLTGLLSSLHRLIDRLVCESPDVRSIRLAHQDGAERRVLSEKTISDLCATMQHAITFQLEDRIRRALLYLKIKSVDVQHVVISGGVASNNFIRSKLANLVENEFQMKMSCPPVRYCTDNGVMIAWNGCEKLEHNSADCVEPDRQDELFFESIVPMGKWEIGEDVSFDVKLLRIKAR